MRRGAEGYTLIELLVAVVILSAGIISIFGAFNTSLSAMLSSKLDLEAYGHISKKLDVIAASGADDAGLREFEGSFSPDDRFSGDIEIRTADLDLSCDADQAGRLYSVEITLNTVDDPVKSYSLLSYVRSIPEAVKE